MDGCHYSILLELPYYDVIIMILCSRPYAQPSIRHSKTHNVSLDSLQYHNAVPVFLPSKNGGYIFSPFQYLIGCIPSKIAIGSSFSAEQWRSWTLQLIYSLLPLKPFFLII